MAQNEKLQNYFKYCELLNGTPQNKDPFKRLVNGGFDEIYYDDIYYCNETECKSISGGDIFIITII
jgi:hypothetical protein